MGKPDITFQIEVKPTRNPVRRRHRHAAGRQEDIPGTSVGPWTACTDVQSWATMVDVTTRAHLEAAAASAGVEVMYTSRERMIRELRR